MAKSLTLEQAGKVLIWFVAGTALLFFGPRYADRLLFDPAASVSTRWLGIAISVGSVIPWLAYVAWGMTVADEYHRQTMLVGTALSFVVAILFSMTTQLMADAHLVAEVITLDLRIGFVIWAVCLGGCLLYRRVRAGE